MTKLDAAIERLRALPATDQERLAAEIESLLDEAAAPSPPDDPGGQLGADEDLARRIEAWRTHRRSTPAADLRADLRRRHRE